MDRRRMAEIAERLREEVARHYERELLETGGLWETGPYAPVGVEEYRQAKVFERVLLDEFAGTRLEDFYELEEVPTEYGPAVAIVDREPYPGLGVKPDRCRQEIERAVRLLWGVGPATEQHLRSSGYRSLRELVHHPRWGPEARRLVEAIDTGRIEELAFQVWRWYTASHPLSMLLLGLINPTQFAFLDIETLGITTEPLILVGIAWPEGRELLVRQLLVRHIPEELPVLMAAGKSIAEVRALVTFNGRAFDLHFLEARRSYYGLEPPPDKPNFDLLFFARRRWREELPNCRLETLERYVLGIERSLDVPSALVPEFYVRYLSEKNIGPLVAIIEHNKQDLVSMALLLSRLWDEWFG
ncbi:MAG: exonuclease [Candidatus Latescibacterota bacterium]|nr:MAG: exonuclease [Candidatus Latescibacterota bacterium]